MRILCNCLLLQTRLLHIPGKRMALFGTKAMSCQQTGSFSIAEIHKDTLSTAHFIFKVFSSKCQAITASNCNLISNIARIYSEYIYLQIQQVLCYWRYCAALSCKKSITCLILALTDHNRELYRKTTLKKHEIWHIKSMWFKLKSPNGFLDKITAIICNDCIKICPLNLKWVVEFWHWSDVRLLKSIKSLSFSSNRYVLQVQHIMCNHKTQIPVIILIMMRVTQCR